MTFNIAAVLPEFETQLIGDIGLLKNVKQTAFAWSNTPFSIALATGPKYFKQALANPNIIAIITTQIFSEETHNKTVIKTANADELFHVIHNRFPPVINNTKAYIGENCKISPQATIEDNVRIGNNCHIEAGAYIGSNTVIEDDCYIGPNATIGTQALLSKKINGQNRHIEHLGGVLIKTGCAVHASSNISKAVYSNHVTHIGAHCQLGIQVNVSHDAYLADNCILSGNVSITGRAKLAENVWVGTGSTISNWVVVGANALIRAGSVVIQDVGENQDVSGNFASPHVKRLKQHIEQTHAK
ncbi:DapH/DapD/GlmU-related protein [Psychrosphaera sp. 1_MG-2023]|uniref:DapH/DapD/GlmU-related protein n=1 Tax=Psychrosphaera sp. 1_MG-2023 TaxID=3062643 RepID=UPI0026E22B3E|nr:DapH/DapD/GlmU-related protein [Psychrosphaera sp. 1_MG-2023]MDO6718387.1 DapH/DapD/GlmU-related protein [Psychrosphaera sp. 1_MG-2023]